MSYNHNPLTLSTVSLFGTGNIPFQSTTHPLQSKHTSPTHNNPQWVNLAIPSIIFQIFLTQKISIITNPIAFITYNTGSNKREKDRESGTGRPIKAIAPKGGSGQGNWGSDQQQIDRAVNEHEASGNQQENRFRKRGKDKFDNFADLNPDEKDLPKKSWDEYNKEKGKKKSVTEYKDNKGQMKKIKREHDFKKKYKPNKYEQETDKLFSGDGKKRNKNRKKKKKKVLLQTQVYYTDRRYVRS